MKLAKADISKILKENQKRCVGLNTEYDPITGQGSPIPRFKCMSIPGATVYLPLQMKSEPVFSRINEKGWENTAKALFSDTINKTAGQLSALENLFHVIRCMYDYEYWCATCVTIQDNLSNEVPLILNPPQRLSLKDREEMRVAGEPVRQIELKHRQYGSTTEKNAYVFWLQNVRHEGYRAYICSLDTTASTKIVGRYEVIANNYPAMMGNVKLRPYMGLRNTYQVAGTGSIVNIGTAENPNAPSGDTTQIALISEAGKMKSTAAKGANKLITNIMSMVPLKPNTYVMIESTAEDSGAWFRSQVTKAKNKESGFHLTFISWLTDPRCQLDFESEAEMKSFIASMDEYERDTLWEVGATLQQIHWYRNKALEYEHRWEMMQENPTTVEEAFQTTGRRYFHKSITTKLRKTCCEPIAKGDLFADDRTGKEAFSNLLFDETPNGELWIWRYPHEPLPEDGIVTNRYASFVDIGGKTKDADYSVISVFDRYWMTEGGFPERVATWRGHLDQDLFAWKAAQVAYYYDKALLAIERNSLRSKGENTEGTHHLTVLDEIAEHYPNLFARNSPDKLRPGMPLRYGFFTGDGTKEMILSTLNKAGREDLYYETDVRLVDEMDAFEIKDDGKLGAKEGFKDDILITTAGGLWLSLQHMDMPVVVTKSNEAEMKLKLIKNIQGSHAVL